MSVYVRVELWPGGDRTKAKLLQEAMIANVGGDGTRGDYAVKVSHSTTYKGSGFADARRPVPAEVWKEGRIANHARNLSPFHLVCKAIGAAIGLTAARPDDGSTVERKRRFDPDTIARPATFQPAQEPTPTPAPTPTPPAASEPRCRYCGKPSDSHVATIFENRERRTYRFCSPTCATYYQMGAEG